MDIVPPVLARRTAELHVTPAVRQFIPALKASSLLFLNLVRHDAIIPHEREIFNETTGVKAGSTSPEGGK